MEYRVDPNWRSNATCKGMDPNIFFPEDIKDERLACQICENCPVTVDCFVSAVEEERLRRNVPGLGGSIVGVRGGKPARTRWLVLQGKLTISQALDNNRVYNVRV